MRIGNAPSFKNLRRVGAFERLKEQLKTGIKPVKILEMDDLDNLVSADVPLQDKDVKRINKELLILGERIVSPESARSTRTKKAREGRRRYQPQ